MLVSCCALAKLLSRSNNDRVDINKNNNTKTIKQLVMISTKLDPYGQNGEDLGEVQDVDQNYVLTQKGMLSNKERFYIPRYLVEKI